LGWVGALWDCVPRVCGGGGGCAGGGVPLGAVPALSWNGEVSLGVYISLYTILFCFKALSWESIILVCLHPTCKACPIAILSHDHWAIYALLPSPLLYAVNHTILVMAISCKGQGIHRRAPKSKSGSGQQVNGGGETYREGAGEA